MKLKMLVDLPDQFVRANLSSISESPRYESPETLGAAALIWLADCIHLNLHPQTVINQAVARLKEAQK